MLLSFLARRAENPEVFCFYGQAVYIYILASQRNGTLYVGMTNDLVRRVFEHRQGLVEGFSKKYGVKTPVYFETCDDPNVAIAREKAIKHWPRQRKLRAIEAGNPLWRDLADELI